MGYHYTSDLDDNDIRMLLVAAAEDSYSFDGVHAAGRLGLGVLEGHAERARDVRFGRRLAGLREAKVGANAQKWAARRGVEVRAGAARNGTV